MSMAKIQLCFAESFRSQFKLDSFSFFIFTFFFFKLVKSNKIQKLQEGPKEENKNNL